MAAYAQHSLLLMCEYNQFVFCKLWMTMNFAVLSMRLCMVNANKYGQPIDRIDNTAKFIVIHDFKV